MAALPTAARLTKSGIARVQELYPDQESYLEYVRSQKINWPLIVRHNPMGVVIYPGVAFLGEDKELRPPMRGFRYTAFFDDLMGIRAGMICLAAGKTLKEGLTRLLRDEFAAASLLKRIPASAVTKAEVCAAIIAHQTGAGELYPKALIRAAIALASSHDIDRDEIARVLARVA